MMWLFFGLFVLTCLYKIQLKPKNGEKYMTDYMSVDKTMSIKGIFILIVFFSHFNSYVTYTSAAENAYLSIFKLIGQGMVTLFLFYSGYGVMESVRKKGIAYVHKIPVTRVLGTLFRFDIALIFFVVTYLAFSKPFTVKQLLLSLIGWDAVGNSNWYIFAVLIAYIITFAAFELTNLAAKKLGPVVRGYISAALVTAGCLLYIYVLAHYKLKASYWYDTIICYAMGMWYSLCRERLEKITNCNNFVYIITLAASAAGTVYFLKTRSVSFIHTELFMVFFTALVVVLTMRISLHNKVLMWCGKNLFGLYILQRIPMIIFKELGVAQLNIYLYFILCLAVTVPMAWAFEKYVGRLWKIISTPRKKTT